MNNGYLLDEYPLLVMPSLAKKIGLNKAIVLQQCHYWLQRTNRVRDGRKWFFKTYEEWLDELPFWSERTIRRTITELEKDKLLITDNFNQKRSDKTKWYTINYEIFNQIMNEKLVTSPCGQNDQSIRSDCPEPCGQNDRIYTRYYKDIYKDITNKSSNHQSVLDPRIHDQFIEFVVDQKMSDEEKKMMIDRLIDFKPVSLKTESLKKYFTKTLESVRSEIAVRKAAIRDSKRIKRKDVLPKWLSDQQEEKQVTAEEQELFEKQKREFEAMLARSGETFC